MEESKENVIEFLTGESHAIVTFNQRKYVNKMKRLAAKFPKECEWIVENKDGSVCAKIPLTWIKISHPRQVSDEQREAARDRLLNSRKKEKR